MGGQWLIDQVPVFADRPIEGENPELVVYICDQVN